MPPLAYMCQYRYLSTVGKTGKCLTRQIRRGNNRNCVRSLSFQFQCRLCTAEVGTAKKFRPLLIDAYEESSMFRSNVISSEEVQNRASEMPVDLQIKARKWRWIGHTLRKGQTAIEKHPLNWGRRRWRRSKSNTKNWGDVKTMALNRVAGEASSKT